MVYVIENNLYGITVDSRRVTKEHDLAKRAIGYGIPGYTIDGNDVETVYKTMQKAVKHAREGKGPSIVECKTYRHHGHNGSDPGTYRPPEEVEAWKSPGDPLILFPGIRATLQRRSARRSRIRWNRRFRRPASLPLKAPILRRPS